MTKSRCLCFHAQEHARHGAPSLPTKIMVRTKPDPRLVPGNFVHAEAKAVLSLSEFRSTYGSNISMLICITGVVKTIDVSRTNKGIKSTYVIATYT